MTARRLLLGAVVLLAGVAVVRQSTADAASYCTVAEKQSFLDSMSALVPMRPPVAATDSSSAGAYYRPGSSTPTIWVAEGCTTASVLAHEFGHYVTDVAAGFSWARFQTIAGQFSDFRNWLKQSADLPGYERAAHCIGYRWVPDGPYTRCPYEDARRIADQVIISAAAASRPAAPTGLKATVDEEGLLIEWRPSGAGNQRLFLNGVEIADLGRSASSYRTTVPAAQAVYQLMVSGEYSSNLSSWLTVSPDGSFTVDSYVAPLPPVLQPPAPPATEPPATTQPPVPSTQPAATAAPVSEPTTTTVPVAAPAPEPEWIDVMVFPEIEVEPDPTTSIAAP